MRICVRSRRHICFHEAGHIEAAYLFGATVRGASLDVTGDPRTSVDHKPDLSTKDPVACGGYAAERILFSLHRLVDQYERPLTEQAFQLQAMDNARLDKFPFYIKHKFDRTLGIYPGSLFQPIDGLWPVASDAPFIAYAEQHVVPVLEARIGVVEALALELDRRGKLNHNDIEIIRRSASTADDV